MQCHAKQCKIIKKCQECKPELQWNVNENKQCKSIKQNAETCNQMQSTEKNAQT